MTETESDSGGMPGLRHEADPRPGVGIVHLGPGAFFRAFNAIYTAEAMAKMGGDWRIVAVSLRSGEIRQKLQARNYAYTSVSLAPGDVHYQTIDVIDDVLVAPEDPQRVIDLMASPYIHVVSMTVTEKGYCHNPATAMLQADHEDVVHDLNRANLPKSVPGLLVRAQEKRRTNGVAPFTVLSCDNLPDNGKLTRNIVLDFARKWDADLAEWIAQEGRFPSTMVDRITPATQIEDIEKLAKAQGYVDEGCVIHEPFRQWVIEDDFVGGSRPQWEAAGAMLVSDVAPFEIMKLRCLNGTHSALAYLGYLAGYETISETVADADFQRYLDYLWGKEILPTVVQPEGENLQAYCATLKQRYLNPSIQHRTWQIAMDGSQKLPQRILATVSDNLEAGRPVNGLCLAVAAWMRYVGGKDEQGHDIDVRDPMAARLQSTVNQQSQPADIVTSLLSFDEIFDPALAGNAMFQSELTAAYEALTKQGVKSVLPSDAWQ